MAQISVLTSILLGFLNYYYCCFILWPDWPGTHYVDQAWPQTPSDWPASASYVIKGVCHQAHTPLLKKDLYFTCMNVVLPACISMQFGACPVPVEAGREDWIPWNWSYWGL